MQDTYGDDYQDLLVDIDLDLPDHIEPSSGWVAGEPAKQRLSEGAKKAAEIADQKGDQDAPPNRELEEAKRAAREAQARLDALTQQSAADRERALKAEGDAHKMETTALTAHAARMKSEYDRANSDKTQVKSHIAQWNSHVEMAKQNLIAARESGDAKTEAEMQDQIAQARAQIAQLEQTEVNVDREIQRLKAEADKAVAQVQRSRQAAAEREERLRREAEEEAKKPKPVDPDQYVEKVRNAIGDYGADWFKEHKEFAVDGAKNRRAQAFVEDWVDRNGEAALRTPAFKEALEARFFPENVKKKDPDPEPQTTRRQEKRMSDEDRDAQAAAPPGRQSNSAASGGNGSGGGGSKMRLTQLEAEHAVELFPDLDPAAARKQYAENKAKLMAAGKL